MQAFSFLPFPECTTKRLLLRELRPGDVSAIFSLRSSESVNKYLDRPIEPNSHQAEAFIHKIQTGVKEGTWIYWTICLKPADNLIGTVCLWNFSVEQQSAELGYELLPTYQGRGLMQEAVENTLAYGFNTLKLQKIIAGTHSENTASLRLLRKTGFNPAPRSASSDTESFLALNNWEYFQLHQG
jgi:ribosomal-protein-alanine N-acetyltransferase